MPTPYEYDIQVQLSKALAQLDQLRARGVVTSFVAIYVAEGEVFVSPFKVGQQEILAVVGMLEKVKANLLEAVVIGQRPPKPVA